MRELGNKRFDVIVLGSGPAGLAAAITARQNNLETLVIEARPRPATRPGESLHPGLEPLFRQLGIAQDIEGMKLHRNRGHWVEDGRTRQFVPYGSDDSGPWYGFQIPRAALNQTLWARTEQLGVTVLTGLGPSAPILDNAGVRGVLAGGQEIESRITIDATGSRHWLARKLGLRTRYGSPRLFAAYTYQSHRDAPKDPAFTYRPKGWRWRANIGEGQVALVDLDLSGAQLPKRPARGADVTWEKVSDSAGSGYFLVGDAAGKLDPASGNGVLRAFMTAMLAASAAAAAIKDPDGAQQQAMGYRQWHRDWLHHDAKRLAEIYRQAPFQLDWAGQQDGNFWAEAPFEGMRRPEPAKQYEGPLDKFSC